MKECPVCHKPIRENARFCLHCMSVLSPKKSLTHPLRAARLLPLLYAFLVFVFLSGAGVGLCSLFWGENEAPLKDPIPTEETEGDSEGESASHDPSESHTVEDSSETENTPDEGAAASTSQTHGTTAGSSKTSSTKSQTSTTGKTTKKATTTTTTTKKATTTTSTPTTTTKAATPSAPAYVPAEYEYRFTTDVEWGNFKAGEGIVITGIKTLSSDYSYVIPETIEGKPVVKIEGKVFYRFGYTYYPDDPNKAEIKIKKLVLPNTLRVLGHRCFSKALDVEELVIPSSVVNSDYEIFTSAKIDRLVIRCKTITFRMFAFCTVGNMVISEGVEQINNHAFLNATVDSYVSFPKSLKKVDQTAFEKTAFHGNSYFILPAHLQSSITGTTDTPFGLTKEIRWE